MYLLCGEKERILQVESGERHLRENDMQKLAERLRQCGCSDRAVGGLLRMREESDPRRRVRNIIRCRCHVQEQICQTERKISCLDFLIYRLSRRRKRRGNRSGS